MQPIDDKVTTVVATAGLFSPFWLDTLREISSVSAILLPIISLVWITSRVIKLWVNNKDE